MESLRFFSTGGGSNVSLSGTTLTIGDETHTLADPTTVASHDTAINDLQTNESSMLGSIGAHSLQISSLSGQQTTNTSAIATNTTAISAANTDIGDLQSCVGTSESNLGIFNPSTNYVQNNSSVRNAVIALDTQVQANNTLANSKSTVLPTGTGGSTLSNVTIDGTAYQVGTNVVANPSTGATTDLTKLTVGSTTYDIPGTVPSASFKFENNTSHSASHTVLYLGNNTERKIGFSFDHNFLGLSYDSTNYTFSLPPGKYIITAQIDYRMAITASSALRLRLMKGSTEELYAREYYHYKQQFNQFLNQGDLNAGFAHATISGLIESTSVNDAYSFSVFYDSNSTSTSYIDYSASSSKRPLGWIIKVG